MWILCCSCGKRLTLTTPGYRCNSCTVSKLLPRELYKKIVTYLTFYTPKNIWSTFLLSYYKLRARQDTSLTIGPLPRKQQQRTQEEKAFIREYVP